MTVWHSMDSKRINANDFIAMIEISKGSKTKYEMDKETGLIILDRILSTSTQYPANYGFIPKTLSNDGDPLDVLVLSTENLQPGSLVRCYPIGVVAMLDNDKNDEKIIAIPFNDPYYNEYKNLEDLPKHVSEEMLHFLSVYKALESTVTVVKELKNKKDAEEVIEQAKKEYSEFFK